MAPARVLATLLVCVWLSCIQANGNSEGASSGVFSVSNVRLAVIDSDSGSLESQQK